MGTQGKCPGIRVSDPLWIASSAHLYTTGCSTQSLYRDHCFHPIYLLKPSPRLLIDFYIFTPQALSEKAKTYLQNLSWWIDYFNTAESTIYNFVDQHLYMKQI